MAKLDDYLKQARSAVASIVGAAFSRGKDEDGKGPEKVLLDLFAPRSVAGARRRLLVQSTAGVLAVVCLVAFFARPSPHKTVSGVVSHLEVTNGDTQDKTSLLMEEERLLRYKIEAADETTAADEKEAGTAGTAALQAASAVQPKEKEDEGDEAKKQEEPQKAEHEQPQKVGEGGVKENRAGEAESNGDEEKGEVARAEAAPDNPQEPERNDEDLEKKKEAEDQEATAEKDAEADLREQESGIRSSRSGASVGRAPVLEPTVKEFQEQAAAGFTKREPSVATPSDDAALKAEAATSSEAVDNATPSDAAVSKEEAGTSEAVTGGEASIPAEAKEATEEKETVQQQSPADEVHPKEEGRGEGASKDAKDAEKSSSSQPKALRESKSEEHHKEDQEKPAKAESKEETKDEGEPYDENEKSELPQGTGEEETGTPAAPTSSSSPEKATIPEKGEEKGEAESLSASDFEKEETSSTDDVTTGELTRDDEEGEKLAAAEAGNQDRPPTAVLSTSTTAQASAEAKIVTATAEAIAKDPVKSADPVQCQGRMVYIYPLPARFNRALVEQCQTLLPWYNMCPHFLNHGLGKLIRSSSFMKPSARWFETHSYALEMIFHYHLRRAYPCITSDPGSADLFYVPYYASLDVMRWHFRKDSTLEATNHLAHSLIRWLTKHYHFRRYNGSDHVMVLGKVTWDFRRHGNSTWGNNFLLQPEMKHVTRLLLEATEWDSSDVAVPHPTYFHPRQENDLGVWQREVKNHARTILVSFAALRGHYPPLKDALAKQCQMDPKSCRYMDCQEDICSSPEAVLGLYMDSHFCLLPPGYESVRRAPFDAMLTGCIPVFFDSFFLKQYKWHLPSDPNLYSVHFNEADVVAGRVNVIQELANFGMRKARKLRKSMVYTVLPGLLYNHPKAKLMEDHEDAFDITMDHLFRRIKKRKAPFAEALAAAKSNSTEVKDK